MNEKNGFIKIMSKEKSDDELSDGTSEQEKEQLSRRAKVHEPPEVASASRPSQL